MKNIEIGLLISFSMNVLLITLIFYKKIFKKKKYTKKKKAMINDLTNDVINCQKQIVEIKERDFHDKKVISIQFERRIAEIKMLQHKIHEMEKKD